MRPIVVVLLVIITVLAVDGRPNLPPKQVPNADQLGEHFEGDIVFAPDQFVSPYTGIQNTWFRWINGIVPYTISSSFSAADKTLITSAMSQISSKTCIKFVERTTEVDYITIMNENSGCWSYVGRVRNAQVLNLQASGGCTHVGIATHELIHALGFFHAQSDVNRNDYVTVFYENIIANKEHNFEVYTNSYVTDYGHGYDLGSIMHYDEYAFSKNGLKTMTPKVATNIKIGQRNGMSDKDIAKIKSMYC